MSLFTELKRRNVFRVAAAYVVMSWVLLQVADVGLEAFEVPAWTFRLLVLALAIGLVPVVVFSWAFELTPEGIKKESEVDRSQSVTHQTGQKLNYLTIAMVVIGVAIALLQYKVQPGMVTPPVESAEPGAAIAQPAAPAAETESRSIAVLPFVNMSSDPENEYFADGLSEELLNQFVQIPDLQVAGRTSSFSYKGKNEDLRVIGATLGVANVLEGSVRRQGDTVRVTAQLIRAKDGFHLWSQTYDRTMDDVFAIQDDIAASVAEAMKIVLDEDARQRMHAAGVRNVEAFTEYQKGKELFLQAHGGEHLMDGLRLGLPHFDRAIELVPDFGAAYWQKSDYYAHVLVEADSTDDERAQAMADLREVLDAAHRYSDDALRRAYIDVDRALFSDDWSPLRGRIEKALAAEGCPNPTWIELASGLGYAEQSLDMWTRYRRCEPLSALAPLKQAQAAYWTGNLEQALDFIVEAEGTFGTNPWYSATKQWVYLGMGRSDDALAQAPEVEKDHHFAGMGARAMPLAQAGDIEGARLAMQEWTAVHGRNLRSEIEIHAAIGDRQRVNELAAEADARPAGPFLLLLTAVYCGCGELFDLEATPNFRQRITESGIDWPLETISRYPAKGW